MKSLIISSLLILVGINSYASVLIVDNKANRPAGANIYSTFVDAQTAAVDGDTLLITPSGANYASFTISKNISIIGGGFNTGKDITMNSVVPIININAGVSNILISGMVISNYLYLGNGGGTVSNLIIEKNKINYVQTAAATLSNIVFRGNLFETSNTNTYPVYLTSTNQSNILFSNNIFSRVYIYGVYVINGGVTFDHNLFMGNGSMYAIYSLENCLVTNNIFYGSYALPNVASTINYQNNLTFGTNNNTFPTGAGYTLSANQEGQDPLFVNMVVGLFNYTLDPSLGAGSPAIGAGVDGSDLGIYGGATPYKNSGVSLPVVKSVIMPTSIVQGTNTSADIIVSGK